MAESNDTQNPSTHQQLSASPPQLLPATSQQIAMLQNFLNYQLDIATYRAKDCIQVKGGHLNAFVNVLNDQLETLKLTLSQELTPLHVALPETGIVETGVQMRMQVRAIEKGLQEMLEALMEIERLRQELTQAVSKSTADA